MNKFSKKFYIAKGIVFGLLLSSIIAYAIGAKPHTFTAGQVISATQVNANFDDLYLQMAAGRGMIVEFASNFSLTCISTSTFAPVVFDVIIRDDSGYNTTTGVYTAPKTDYYTMSAKISPSTGKYNFAYSSDGGTNWTYFNYSGGSTTLKLAQGSTIIFGHYCDDSKGDTTSTIDSTQSFVTILPL